jgi:Helix-turn-helix domain
MHARPGVLQGVCGARDGQAQTGSAESWGRAGGESIHSISRRLERSPSTIGRELARNHGAAGGYRATTAHPLVCGPSTWGGG